MLRALVPALLVLILAGPAGAATVDGGALRAETSGSPWNLRFTDSRGEDVLRQAAGTGTGPTGTLGFRTPAGWFHATRVTSERRDGAAWAGTLATNDPAGRTLAVRIERDADGVIAVAATVQGATLADVQATGIAFEAVKGERYVGFGERSNAVDQRGRTVENFVSDGPYRSDEYALISVFVPPAGFVRRDDATYFPMPWLLSTRGYGVLMDDDETSNFRLGSDDAGAWSMEVAAPRVRFRVFAGPKPADVVRRLSERLGRQPPPDAPFFLGPWYQPRRGDEAGERDRLLAADVPTSVAQTYTHYLPCGDQVGSDQKTRTSAFHAAGMAVTTYFNPMICTTYQPVYDQAKAAGALNTNAAGQTYEYRYTGSTVFFVAQFDFFADAGKAFYGRLLDEAMADGYDGWMEDFGEYTPDDARSADGRTGTALHNDYVRGYHCAAYDAVRRQSKPIARFQRSGWTGVAPCAQIVWGGDPTTDFGFDGLSSAVTQALTLGFSGISRWGSDIGGYFSLMGRKLSPELFKRWIEFGAVSGVMRTQANGFAVPGYDRPQLSDPEILPLWRRYAKLRTQLYPYIAAADAEYRRSGMPVMRHLALVHPDDARAVGADDEFMFGPDLLAAPVLEAGATKRELYVPRGSWVDLWRSVRFDSKSGGLTLGRASTLDGSRTVELPAPLDELPLLARRGTVIPLLVPDVDTLADYGDGKRQVRLADRANRLDLLAFPYGRITTKLEDGSTLVSRDRGDRWVLSVNAKRSTTFRVQASLGTLKKPFKPCAVEFAGKRVAWSYSAKTRVLRARFTGAKDRLVVTACPD